MNIEQKAIERLRTASELSLNNYGKPLTVCYSGGKDSDVMLTLSLRAEIPLIVQHKHTTVDAPETVYYVRNKFRELEEKGVKCEILYPKYTMWQLIIKNGIPPLRDRRYCCRELKEYGNKNELIATGVRREESKNRSDSAIYQEVNRKKPERQAKLMYDNDDNARVLNACLSKQNMQVRPIVDWSNRDIYEYIDSENIEINPLYACGYERVGCIGCPNASKGRYAQFARYPEYKRNYIKAFDKMLEKQKSQQKQIEYNWSSGEAVFLWWLEDDNIPGQIYLECEGNGELNEY